MSEQDRADAARRRAEQQVQRDSARFVEVEREPPGWEAEQEDDTPLTPEQCDALDAEYEAYMASLDR
jgi:hypothetical protein